MHCTMDKQYISELIVGLEELSLVIYSKSLGYKGQVKNQVSIGFSLITYKVVIPWEPNFYSISKIGNPNI